MEYDFDYYLKQPFPFEAEISLLFKNSSPITIFEIGACEGEDTIKLRRRFPNAKIYAFEPLPKNVRRIKQNLKKYSAKNIKLFEVAFSSKNGASEFHVSSGHPDDQPKTKNWDFGNKSSSLLPPKEHKKTHGWIKFNRKIKVATQRLDAFCRKQGVSNIDFVYMDVQGAELMVLEGAGALLSNVGAIWMEVEAVELYDKQPLKNDVEAFMKKNGFICIKDTVNEISGDQFYISRSMARKLARRKLLTKVKTHVPRPAKRLLRSLGEQLRKKTA